MLSWSWMRNRCGSSLDITIRNCCVVHSAVGSLAEGIDATTPAGKLQMHILGAIAEFERGRIKKRVVAGLQLAKAQGKRLGRPRVHAARIELPGGNVRAAAKVWGVSKTTAARWIAAGATPPNRESNNQPTSPRT